MAAKRPQPILHRSGTPIRNISQDALNEMAARARYYGSPKHRFGAFQGEIGRPGGNPTTVEQASAVTPTPPFCMICPERWTQLPDRQKATTLLQEGIKRGQIGYPIEEGLPRFVWVRDPDDKSVVYEARRLSWPVDSYKAYPLIEPQVAMIGLKIS
jgi:hypothetical protein